MSDLNILTHNRHGERFIFIFRDEHRRQAMKEIMRCATDPESRLNWWDAAQLCQKVREAKETSK